MPNEFWTKISKSSLEFFKKSQFSLTDGKWIFPIGKSEISFDSKSADKIHKDALENSNLSTCFSDYLKLRDLKKFKTELRRSEYVKRT